jgi:hypothetical protein
MLFILGALAGSAPAQETDDVARLIELFAGSDPGARLGAARAATDHGPEAIPALLDAMDSEVDNVRRMASIALGGMDAEAAPAVPDLIRILNDSEWWSPSYARMALRGIGTPEALAALESHQERRPTRRSWDVDPELVRVVVMAAPFIIAGVSARWLAIFRRRKPLQAGQRAPFLGIFGGRLGRNPTTTDELPSRRPGDDSQAEAARAREPMSDEEKAFLAIKVRSLGKQRFSGTQGAMGKSGRLQAWRDAASDIGATLHEGDSPSMHTTAGDGWPVRLWVWVKGGNFLTKRPPVTHTRVSASYRSVDGFQFSLGRRSVMWVEAPQEDEARTGFEVFDKYFLITSDMPDRVKELFASQSLREAVVQQPIPQLSIIAPKKNTSLGGRGFELEFDTPSFISSSEHLLALHLLFGETLDRLREIGSAKRA